MMTRYDPREHMRRSVEFAYAAIRERVTRGGRGWNSRTPQPSEIAGPRTFVRTNEDSR
jgi:hypothetical protein